ncbi:hypothetical protein PTTG_07998 [Puccinia triticina 1-1 BBBD Race 1]|uniref:Uncharacterized protein n=1 Tax=Puccinia triticina (isolate 1-1 / race 1 (BBBD)) TaxID=630390 RepID=A0A180G5V1_PUCT1|nr:hypothetical protein PTTG_07998 [Puccinia triticina 1-1 BBBD Race 1]
MPYFQAPLLSDARPHTTSVYPQAVTLPPAPPPQLHPLQMSQFTCCHASAIQSMPLLLQSPFLALCSALQSSSWSGLTSLQSMSYPVYTFSPNAQLSACILPKLSDSTPQC